LNTEKTKQE